jgi:hypothetical protein
MIRWSGWLREILGWILVLVGLYGFFMALGLIVNRQVIGGTVVGVLSVFMYRSGVGFLKMAAKKRDFTVIVAETDPSFDGQMMANELSAFVSDVIVISDSAVFAMMSRVNKVLIGAHAGTMSVN